MAEAGKGARRSVASVAASAVGKCDHFMLDSEVFYQAVRGLGNERELVVEKENEGPDCQLSR